MLGSDARLTSLESSVLKACIKSENVNEFFSVSEHAKEALEITKMQEQTHQAEQATKIKVVI